MEKLGVETDDPGTKTGEEKPRERCPACGAKLLPRDDSNALRCPECGTRPFESR